MMKNVYLAADFGGGSGRVYAGHITDAHHGKQLVIREVHRFRNRTVRIGEFIYWDFPWLFYELKAGLAKAAGEEDNIVSIGIDTWGVDFGLIDSQGNLIGNPVCYRDAHTSGLPEEYFSGDKAVALYGVTGIQMLPINTLFRLLSMYKAGDPRLKIADRLLFMPDLFSYYLTGNADNEYTIATTSELLNARTKDWDEELIARLGFDKGLFGKIIMPGQSRGALLPHVASETGLSPEVKVVAVPSHDTASAIFAADADYERDGIAFLSSGTWSLLGVTLSEPILSEEAREGGFTNEGGADGKICFLSNITGLWILQCLTAEWEKQGTATDWGQLIAEAAKAEQVGVIDVDDPVFSYPDNMSKAIADYCAEHGLRRPATKGEYVLCVCESLASRYAKAVEELNRLLPSPVKGLKIFGGGAKNTLLNELTARYTGLPVQVWPEEATAIGNILSQAIAAGDINDRAEIKDIKTL